MKKLKDSSLSKIIKLQKYKDIYDFSSLECRIALFICIILNVIFIYSIKVSNTGTIISYYISYLDNISIALIGFLGFIVTGLAILTGAISSKVVKKLQERNKIQSLEKILLSFYLLGLVSATIIIFSFVLHFLNILDINCIWQINIILLSVISYLIVFSIFYAVKLIGNCLELFYIINNMQILNDSVDKDKMNYKSKYNNYRIIALEKTVLKNTSEQAIHEYANEILKMIGQDTIPKEEHDLYLKMFLEQFGLNEIFKNKV